MTATAGHEGWYTMHLTLDNSTDYSLILNDDGHGNQLSDVTLSTKERQKQSTGSMVLCQRQNLPIGNM